MIDNTVAAAKAVGARIVLPGTIYNFGPDTFPEITEESPQHPTSVKGAIRVEMERRLQVAAGQGVPVIIVRAGDYFGPHADSSWFSQGLSRPASRLRRSPIPASLASVISGPMCRMLRRR